MLMMMIYGLPPTPATLRGWCGGGMPEAGPYWCCVQSKTKQPRRAILAHASILLLLRRHNNRCVLSCPRSKEQDEMNSVWLQKMKKRQAGDGDSNADAASAVPVTAAAQSTTTKRAHHHHVDSSADASAVAPQQQSSMKRARVDDSSADASAVVAPQSTKRTRLDASSTASVALTTTEAEDLRLPPSLASPPLQTCRAADLQTSSSAFSAPDNLRRDDSPVPPTEIDDRRSCTPTEIEISSSDGEDDLPETVMPYKRWTNMKARVRAVLKAGFTPSHEVVFDLASPCQAWQPHIDYIVNTGLSVRNVTHFKIGISYTPHKRFYYDDYRLLRRMVVCLVTEDCDLTAQAEIDAIKRYRSDHRCRNVSPGGESHDHDVSPHLLYVVFGNICQFPPKRREPCKSKYPTSDE